MYSPKILQIRRSLEEDEDDNRGRGKNKTPEKGNGNTREIQESHAAELREIKESQNALEAELEQSKAYCKSYLSQLTQGGELVKELQKELKTKSDLIAVLNEEMQEMEHTATTLKTQIKSKSEELKTSSKVSSEIDHTINTLEKELRDSRRELEVLKSQLVVSQRETEDACRKAEKLEKNGGSKPATRGRSGGGYDANIDRISDLEDELELVKIRLESVTSEHANVLKGKEQEADYYREQSEQYLIKLQEVRPHALMGFYLSEKSVLNCADELVSSLYYCKISY
jgi:DNA repair exonuclease SbcCD ATPase subunit